MRHNFTHPYDSILSDHELEKTYIHELCCRCVKQIQRKVITPSGVHAMKRRLMFAFDAIQQHTITTLCVHLLKWNRRGKTRHVQLSNESMSHNCTCRLVHVLCSLHRRKE